MTETSIATADPKPVKLRKLSGQQEKFCIEFIRTGIGAEAYRRCYKIKPGEEKAGWVYQEASALLALPQISRRLEELWAEQANISLGEVVNGFRIARDMSFEDRNPSGATGALTQMGKLGKLYPDERGFGGNLVNIQINLTAEDLGMM